MLIKPNSRTKISNGSCVVKIINNSQLIIFSDEEDNQLLSSYINGSVTISSGSPVYARSEKTNLTIEVIDLTSSGARGAQGVPGPKGERGIPGEQGKQGIPGVKGADGIPGIKGADGKVGAKGADGSPGVKGIDGKAGAKGDPILNIKDSKPLKIWAGTAKELALVVPKAPDVVYLVTGGTV